MAIATPEFNDQNQPRFDMSPPHLTVIDGEVPDQDVPNVPLWMRHFTSVVDVRPYARDMTLPEGTVSFNQYTMSDGVTYRVNEGHPTVQKSEIPVDSTCAWWTQPQGHNARTDRELMAQGYVTRRIGPERMPFDASLGTAGLLHTIQKGWAVRLSYTAHNMLEILDASDMSNSGILQPGMSLQIGESRGAMVEPALQLLSQTRAIKRTIAHSDTVDPCCPDKINLTNPIKLGRIAVSEAEAIIRSAAQIISEADRKDYLQTLDLRPECLVPALMAPRGLLGGEAGQLARLRPRNRPMHLTFMRRSYANDSEKFREIYKSHTDVRIQMRGGSHLDIPRTRRGVIRRHSLIMQQLQQNGDNPTDLDLQKIYELPPRRKRNSLRLV